MTKPPELSSLSTGVLSESSVTCGEAAEKGRAAIREIENKMFSEIHLKRKFTVKSLAGITASIAVRNDTICVNPNQLLHRMVCSVRSDTQLREIFDYELCAYPPF